jgi:hypothetical protein
VRKSLLEKLAHQMDSFDVLKLKELQYLDYLKACDSFLVEQGAVVLDQQDIIINQEKEIRLHSDIEVQREIQLEANTKYIDKLVKMNKGHKIRNKIILIGGGILTVGLTTGLIISLLQ